MLLPEVDDPNFYCRSCKANMKGRKYYKYHLKRVHKIIIVNLVGGTMLIELDFRTIRNLYIGYM